MKEKKAAQNALDPVQSSENRIEMLKNVDSSKMTEMQKIVLLKKIAYEKKNLAEQLKDPLIFPQTGQTTEFPDIPPPTIRHLRYGFYYTLEVNHS